MHVTGGSAWRDAVEEVPITRPYVSHQYTYSHQRMGAAMVRITGVFHIQPRGTSQKIPI